MQEADLSSVWLPSTSTSVALVVTLGISDTAVLGIIKELLEEYIPVDAVVPELIITEIKPAILESNTTVVIAVTVCMYVGYI